MGNPGKIYNGIAMCFAQQIYTPRGQKEEKKIILDVIFFIAPLAAKVKVSYTVK